MIFKCTSKSEKKKFLLIVFFYVARKIKNLLKGVKNNVDGVKALNKIMY